MRARSRGYRDSLTIRENLAKQDAGNAGWQRDLAASYRSIGGVQHVQGDLAGALKSYGDTLAILEKLAKQDPGNAGWQRDLSLCYNMVGDVQRDRGNLAGALKSYRDSLAIAEKLAKQDPGNANWQRDSPSVWAGSAICSALRATLRARSRATATPLPSLRS